MSQEGAPSGRPSLCIGSSSGGSLRAPCDEMPPVVQPLATSSDSRPETVPAPALHS
jgi:hypothetical protein